MSEFLSDLYLGICLFMFMSRSCAKQNFKRKALVWAMSLLIFHSPYCLGKIYDYKYKNKYVIFTNEKGEEIDNN